MGLEGERDRSRRGQENGALERGVQEVQRWGGGEDVAQKEMELSGDPLFMCVYVPLFTTITKVSTNATNIPILFPPPPPFVYLTRAPISQLQTSWNIPAQRK